MRKRQESFCKGNTCLTNLIDSEGLNKHVDKREIQSIQPVWVCENYSTRPLTSLGESELSHKKTEGPYINKKKPVKE